VLALGIRYLNGFAVAAEPNDLRRAEWPPHPGRVFMALAAAHFQTGADSDERDALVWLEALEEENGPAAPSIVAPRALERALVTHFVPVNDDNAGCKKKNDKTVVFQEIGQTGLRRNRQDRTFARAWLEHDTVYMVWSSADPADPTRKALASLCSKVTRIGHSSSLVQMWVARQEEVGEPNWVPDDEHAAVHLRIAPRGTLSYLEQQFNGNAVENFGALQALAEDPSDRRAQKAAKKRLKDEFPDGPPCQIRPTLSVYQGYTPPVLGADDIAACTVFGPGLICMRLEREQGPHRHLDLCCVLALCQRWRDALLSQCRDLASSARRILSGHDADGAPLQTPHLAFVPQAFVGHEHAQGHLMGVGIALPSGLSRNDRRDVLQVISRVRHLNLGRLGVWRIEPISVALPPRSLRAETWTAYPNGATQWSTVTPIAFDHHPKSKGKGAYLDEAAAMIALGCTRIGLPAPREIMVMQVSAHLGVPPAHQFPRLHRKDGSLRRHAHAIIVFNELVCGPVLLGAGRYRGYGLCRPLDGADTEGTDL
jgi:CRISPR-associated protein Csb2